MAYNHIPYYIQRPRINYTLNRRSSMSVHLETPTTKDGVLYFVKREMQSKLW